MSNFIKDSVLVFCQSKKKNESKFLIWKFTKFLLKSSMFNKCLIFLYNISYERMMNYTLSFCKGLHLYLQSIQQIRRLLLMRSYVCVLNVHQLHQM